MHVNNANCPSCEAKLKQAHPDLSRWVQVLRATHPDAHVSCGHRGQADQEAAYKAGTSRAHYGQSAHNCVPAMAVDLFRLTQANGAAFDRSWYRDVIAPIIRAAGLITGGDFTTLQDWPHVEMPGFLPFSAK